MCYQLPVIIILINLAIIDDIVAKDLPLLTRAIVYIRFYSRDMSRGPGTLRNRIHIGSADFEFHFGDQEMAKLVNVKFRPPKKSHAISPFGGNPRWH